LSAIPIRIPEQWEPAWFRRFYVEVLANGTVNGLAAHNADPSAHASLGTLPAGGVTGQWLVKTADNNFSAEWITLDVPGLIEAAVDAHEALPDPHPAYATDSDLTDHIDDATDPHAAADYAQTDVAETITQPWEFADRIAIYTGQDGGWFDIIGQIVPAPLGPNNPTWTILTAGSPFYGWAFGVGDFINLIFHIPHAYASNEGTAPTPIFLHAHWLTDGTSTASVKWEFSYSFARGFNQGASSTFNTTGTVVTAEEAASGTAFQHMVTEIADGISNANFEVDGLLLVRLRRVTNGGTDNPNTVFLLMSDAHVQVDTFATKDRAPNFYT
jgi:hypothetical protein